MACAFIQDIFEMIAMIVDVRTACWSSDQAAARKLETPTARHWHSHQSLRSSKRGGRGSLTMLPRHYEPTGLPPSALWVNGTLQPAHRRRSQKVGQPTSAFHPPSSRRRCRVLGRDAFWENELFWKGLVQNAGVFWARALPGKRALPRIGYSGISLPFLE